MRVSSDYFVVSGRYVVSDGVGSGWDEMRRENLHLLPSRGKLNREVFLPPTVYIYIYIYVCGCS